MYCIDGRSQSLIGVICIAIVYFTHAFKIVAGEEHKVKTLTNKR